MKKLVYLLVIIFMGLTVFVACDKNDENPLDSNNDPNTPTNTIKPGIRQYFTSASHGDIIALTINGDNATYSFINETTNESGSGSFVLSSDSKLSGVYETTVNGKKQYIIELPGVAVVSSLPLGNTENRISFGLSSDIHKKNNYSINDFVGKYLFMNFDEGEKIPEYFLGGYEVKTNGAYTYGFSNHNFSSINFSGYGSRIFNFVEGDNSRVKFTESDGFSGYGSIYPDKLMVMDNGEGNGFSVGVNYPPAPISQNQIAGNYKAVTITTHSGESVMNFSIPDSGKDFSIYEKFNDGTVYDTSKENIAVESFGRMPSFNNIFKGVYRANTDGNIDIGEVYLIILPGEMLMYFSVEEGEIASYGLALKVN